MFAVPVNTSMQTGQPRRTRLRVLVGTVLFAMLTTLMVGLGSTTLAFAEACTESISGNVKGQGTPDVNLSEVYVSAIQVSPGQGFGSTTGTQTNGSGNYTISLCAGDFALSFDASEWPYLSEYLGGAKTRPGSAVVTVGNNATVTGQNAVLSLGATISGNVKQPGSPPTNVPGVMVYAFGANGSASTVTDASGNYWLNGLDSGQYVLHFDAFGTHNVVAQYWGGGIAESSAVPISVIAGQNIVGKNVLMTAGATVSGNVKGAGTPDVNLEEVEVSLERVGGPDFYYFPHNLETDSLGNFTMLGVPPGDYTLRFEPADGTPYPEQYLGGTPDPNAVQTFTVSGNQTFAGKNIVLPKPVTLTGTIYEAGSPDAPVEGAMVEVLLPSGDSVAWTQTAANGTYTLNNVSPGTYTIRASDWGGHTPVYYGDTPILNDASMFQALAGQWWPEMDAVLSLPPMSISGNVKGQGSPDENLPSSGVSIQRVGSDSMTGTGTDANGNYSLPVSEPGTYTVHFYGDYEGRFVGEWWDDQQSEVYAMTFTVAPGQAVTGKNAVLTRASTISGTMTDSAGNGLGGKVWVYKAGASAADESSLVETAYVTNIGGSYEVRGLPVGEYKVLFTLEGVYAPGQTSYPYVPQWSGAKYSYATAASVTISAAGQTVTGVNAALEYPTFEDASDPTSVFYSYIQWMASEAISTGTAQSAGKALYKPSDSVSRQAMAAFMLRLSTETFIPPAAPTFADVDASNPFYAAVEWMAAEGISTGTPQPTGKPLYKPADPVSRQAMALFLARYAEATLTPPTVQSFADVPISASSAAAIAWMASTGISTGTAQPSGLPLYKPADPVSRQAMAAFLYRVNLLPH